MFMRCSWWSHCQQQHQSSIFFRFRFRTSSSTPNQWETSPDKCHASCWCRKTPGDALVGMDIFKQPIGLVSLIISPFVLTIWCRSDNKFQDPNCHLYPQSPRAIDLRPKTSWPLSPMNTVLRAAFRGPILIPLTVTLTTQKYDRSFDFQSIFLHRIRSDRSHACDLSGVSLFVCVAPEMCGSHRKFHLTRFFGWIFLVLLWFGDDCCCSEMEAIRNAWVESGLLGVCVRVCILMHTRKWDIFQS